MSNHRPATIGYSTVSPTVWQRVLRVIADCNPFYLISAACMLGGCLALTNSLSWNSVPLPRLMLLIGTINVYEAVLIALALLLLKRGLARDGNILLVLQAFFLFDVTFLSAEVATANLRVGLAVNAIVFALAVVKLHVVSRALGRALSGAAQVFVAVQLAVLLVIPSILRHVDHGSVVASDFYVLWWVVGLMPAIGEIIRRIDGAGEDRETGAQSGTGVAAGLGMTYALLPWVSLIAHLSILHYVYSVGFYAPMATPVILGFALMLHRAIPGDALALPYRQAPANVQQARALRAILPLLAIVFSLGNPTDLAIDLRPLAAPPLSTGMLALAAAYLFYVYCLFPRQAVALLAGGAAAAALVLYGPSVQQMQRQGTAAWDWSSSALQRAIPTTAAAWGLISVVASFFFLAVGATVSFRSLRLPAPALPLLDSSQPIEIQQHGEDEQEHDRL